MQINQIKPKTKNKKGKYIGRGGKRGTYSGRGIKGQKSRAGRKMRPEMRDLIKKFPKKRGYRFQSFQENFQVVNLGSLDSAFKDNDRINPEILADKGLIKVMGGKMPMVKLLGNGELTKKLAVEKCRTSESAKQKIEKAGGSVK